MLSSSFFYDLIKGSSNNKQDYQKLIFGQRCYHNNTDKYSNAGCIKTSVYITCGVNVQDCMQGTRVMQSKGVLQSTRVMQNTRVMQITMGNVDHKCNAEHKGNENNNG